MISQANGNATLDRPPRPDALPMNFDGIPEAMRSMERWLLWRYDWSKGKWTKVPYQTNGYEASSTDPGTWTTFNRARDAYEQGDFAGLGIALGDGLCGVDLDDVLSDSGSALPWAAKLIADFGTYTEISPSGTGVKMFMLGAFEGGGIGAVPQEGGGEIEVYQSGRYFAVTGHDWSKA